MATTHVYVGAARTSGSLGGIFRRAAGNGHWEQLTKGLPEAINVQAVTVHPTNPDVVHLGGNHGLFPSTARGQRWERPRRPAGRGAVVRGRLAPASPRNL